MIRWGLLYVVGGQEHGFFLCHGDDEDEERERGGREIDRRGEVVLQSAWRGFFLNFFLRKRLVGHLGENV